MNSITLSSLTILLWNANGLSRHTNELDVLLHDRRIDVALITETHFTNKSRFHIRDYTVHRTDHNDNTAHGGSAILIRNQISHSPLQPISTNFLQATNVSVTFKSSSIVISSCYWPPNKPITSTDFVNYFSSLGPKFVAGGDYNSKSPQWGCRSANPRGTSLLSSVTAQNYQIISPTTPTYWPSSRRKLPDILDIFVMSSSIPDSLVTVIIKIIMTKVNDLERTSRNFLQTIARFFLPFINLLSSKLPLLL